MGEFQGGEEEGVKVVVGELGSKPFGSDWSSPNFSNRVEVLFRLALLSDPDR